MAYDSTQPTPDNKLENPSTELEELLQCLVCYELPTSPVFQCDTGHHFCNRCYVRLKEKECPVCKAKYYGTRNYLAENILAKLPFFTFHTPHTQPKPIPRVEKEEMKEIKYTPPPMCRGNFKCLLQGCTKSMPAGRFLPHVRYFHPMKLLEVQHTEREYTQVWELEYKKPSIYENAIRVSSMGLFFVIIKIRENGEMVGCVQMVASSETAAAYTSKIKLLSRCGKREISYKEKVDSCNVKTDDLINDKKCISVCAEELENFLVDNHFSCYISIIRSRLTTEMQGTASRNARIAREENNIRHFEELEAIVVDSDDDGDIYLF